MYKQTVPGGRQIAVLAVYNGVQTRKVEGTQVSARLPAEHTAVQQQRTSGDTETTAAQQAAAKTEQREAAQQRERVSTGQ